jgi:predicted nucleic acid-binding protein
LELDAGESAAIALALELGVSQILLDETDGGSPTK